MKLSRLHIWISIYHLISMFPFRNKIHPLYWYWIPFSWSIPRPDEASQEKWENGFCSLNPLICSLNLLIFSLNPLHLFYGSIHVIFEPTHLFFSSAHLIFESAHVTIRYGHLIFESAHVTFGPAICFLINSCNRWIRSCGL